MRISIFGMGYVGCVGSACCAKLGHHVIGVDVSEHKVELINSGRPTIIEKDIEELVRKAHEEGALEATTDVDYAVKNSEISFIAVGTPSSKEGHLNLNYIYRVAEQIGAAIKDKNEFHIVAIRSTVLPGTNQRIGEIIEEISGKKRDEAFTVVSNPEFLREGTAVHDYLNPPLTLVGADNELAVEKMRELYRDIPGEFIATDIKVAEMMKYINNTYHALKIVFGNEVGNICKALDVDSHKVMEIFCKDKQLNISPYYFKPGFAYGGSCLPKDSKALRTLARDYYVDVPVINAIEESNEIQKRNAVNLIMEKGKRKVGILGLSFKAGTDDLRCSPIVDVVESLLGKGFEGFDANIEDWKLHSNLYFPEVRLRNFLEIRNHDCVGQGLEYAIPAVYKGIMYNPSAMEEVSNMLLKYSYNEINELRYNVAKNATASKLRKHPILNICKELVEIAYYSLKNQCEDEEIFLEPLISMLKKNKIPCEM